MGNSRVQIKRIRTRRITGPKEVRERPVLEGSAVHELGVVSSLALRLAELPTLQHSGVDVRVAPAVRGGVGFEERDADGVPLVEGNQGCVRLPLSMYR